jgi:hypothetical protein
MTCPQEIDVGAYVLDALEPEERLRLRAHLRDCPACAASLRDLEGVPRLLAQVPAPTVEFLVPEAPAPSELAYRRLHRSATAVRPSSRPAGRHRRWLLVAAAAVLVSAAGITGGVMAGTDGGPPTTVAATQGPVQASASIEPSGSGSSITLALDGIQSGEECQLVVVARDGHRETASSWTATYQGSASVTSTVGIAPRDMAELVIQTPDGHTLVAMHA